MTDNDHLPHVPVYLTTNPSGDSHVAYLSCPFCGALHQHGAGDSDGPPDLGLRVAHCAWGEGGQYVLVPGLSQRPKDLSFAQKNRRLLADDARRAGRR